MTAGLVLLEVQPTDRVLDVGCGPGVTVQLLAERAYAGFGAGIDPSDMMVRQARRRNCVAVAQGRVELRRASVSALPYPDAHFTKACAVHSIYFWSSLERGLRELQRVLAPGGRVALAVRMRHANASRFDPSRYGVTDDDVDEIVRTLQALGFHDVTTNRKDGLGRQTMTAVLARR